MPPGPINNARDIIDRSLIYDVPWIMDEASLQLAIYNSWDIIDESIHNFGLVIDSPGPQASFNLQFQFNYKSPYPPHL